MWVPALWGVPHQPCRASANACAPAPALLVLSPKPCAVFAAPATHSAPYHIAPPTPSHNSRTHARTLFLPCSTTAPKTAATTPHAPALPGALPPPPLAAPPAGLAAPPAAATRPRTPLKCRTSATACPASCAAGGQRGEGALQLATPTPPWRAQSPRQQCQTARHRLRGAACPRSVPTSPTAATQRLSHSR